MSTIIKSNQAYTGNKNLPNIIDFISTASERSRYLVDMYSTVSNDTSYITDANADALFSTLTAHRQRVIDDGGIVPSLSQTLRAIIFASKNSLLSSQYRANSPDFGLKMVGSNVAKVYGLSGHDISNSITGSFQRASSGRLTCVTSSGTTSMLVDATSGLTSSSLIIGSSSFDINTASTSKIKAPLLADSSDNTGLAPIAFETNNGNVSRVAYILPSGSNFNTFYSTSGADYKKYAGVVARLAVGDSVSLYENGVQKSSQAAPKDYSDTVIYNGLQVLDSAGSMINESWIIKSDSDALAVALSNHLNKAEFA